MSLAIVRALFCSIAFAATDVSASWSIASDAVKASIGVRVRLASEFIEDLPSRDGVVVSMVAPSSPAEEAGVRVGDVIINVGVSVVSGVLGFDSILQDSGVGSDVELTLLRRSPDDQKWKRSSVSVSVVSSQRVSLKWLFGLRDTDAGYTLIRHRAHNPCLDGKGCDNAVQPELLISPDGQFAFNVHVHCWGNSWPELTAVRFHSVAGNDGIRVVALNGFKETKNGKQHEWCALALSTDQVSRLETILAQDVVLIDLIGANRTVKTRWADPELRWVRDVMTACRLHERDPKVFRRKIERQVSARR